MTVSDAVREKLLFDLSESGPKSVFLIITHIDHHVTVRHATCQHFCSFKLPGIFLSFSISAKEMMNTLSLLGVDPSVHYFLDCVGSKENKSLSNCSFINSPKSLTKMSIEITHLLNPGKYHFLFIDSFSSLLTYNDPGVVEQFARYLVNKVRHHEVGEVMIMVESEKVKLIEEEIQQYCDSTIRVKFE